MAKSFRYVVRQTFGRTRQNCNMPGIITSARAVVQITAGEVKFGTTSAHQQSPPQDFFYHLGDATVWVSNVSPHLNEFAGQAGGVEFFLHVDVDFPIDVGITVTVENDPPFQIQGYE
jgi:hypothetical protein